MNLRTRLFLPVLASMMGLSGCDGSSVIPDCNNLGTDSAALKATAVLSAVDELALEADMLADELFMVCDGLATELGITRPTPADGETPRESLCGAVAQEIAAILEEADAAITVTVEPAVCDFSVEVYADCVARCDVDVTADVDVQCTEGQLSGSCSGECSGTCAVEGSATCTGTCTGTCSGQCDGACTGECIGTCSATDDAGNCVGTCDGTCMGTCSATCTGSCSGTCTAEVTGSCEGTCRGSCDVDFVAPRCDGQADVNANAECRAACDAEVQAMGTCSEPRVTVGFDGGTTAGRLADLQRALQIHWPTFVSLRARLEAGASSANRVRQAAVDLRDATVATAACLVLSIEDVVAALASFEVSVEVTVEVSATVVVQ